MEQKIGTIINACKGLNLKSKNRKIIVDNYQLIFEAIQNEGFEYFIAHNWAMMKMETMYGSVIVSRAFTN